MEFIGFADVNDFLKISGISKHHFENEVFPNLTFQERFVYRFGKGGKRYIEVKPAIEYIKNELLKKEVEL
ncbi:hypothetical protein [Mammaliicoccus sciuri]|uniref:hypothetical protein n=1 Tax=Mammaliicoccus sciuri TaxID=1296 RepID=UPI0036E7B101